MVTAARAVCRAFAWPLTCLASLSTPKMVQKLSAIATRTIPRITTAPSSCFSARLRITSPAQDIIMRKPSAR